MTIARYWVVKTGGIDIPEDIEFVCNGDVLAMMVPGGM